MNSAELLIWGVVLHLIADWIFQNHWMAINKANLKHPAGYIHAGIHGIMFLILVSPPIALVVALSHLLIDTRKPIQLWQKLYKQTQDGVYAIHVQIWLDQVFHIAIIAIMAILVG